MNVVLCSCVSIMRLEIAGQCTVHLIISLVFHIQQLVLNDILTHIKTTSNNRYKLLSTLTKDANLKCSKFSVQQNCEIKMQKKI